jgi:methylenetetrahydrofolate dehydrogenase (NADP+)/methenyltetrahydrofolate cyclohydrolase
MNSIPKEGRAVSARILDGKQLAATILDELASEVSAARASRPPGLAAILVGEDPASQVYVRNKLKACERCGIRSYLEHLPATSTQGEVAAVLERLNGDDGVDGILLQLPLPAGLDAKSLLWRLNPAKDVDGLHPVSLGKLVADDPDGFVPCTPAGVVELLRRNDVALEGQRVVVLGRSNLVGKPLALLLLRRQAAGNATVTVVHTRSRDIPDLVSQADVLVAAAGSPRFVQGSWLRPGAVVVDVGIHRLPTKKLVGDVDFESAAAVASAITPVPGGVGPMTVAMLMRNTVLGWRRGGRQ